MILAKQELVGRTPKKSIRICVEGAAIIDLQTHSSTHLLFSRAEKSTSGMWVFNGVVDGVEGTPAGRPVFSSCSPSLLVSSFFRRMKATAPVALLLLTLLLAAGAAKGTLAAEISSFF